MAKVARPTFSIASGIYDSDQNSIQVNCATAGAFIRYKLITPSTTDLSPPTSTVGTLVANGGFISSTLGAIAILAIAYKSGEEDSYVSSFIRINASRSLLGCATFRDTSMNYNYTKAFVLLGPYTDIYWSMDTLVKKYPTNEYPIIAAREGQALIQVSGLWWYAAPNPNRKETDGSEFNGSQLANGTNYPCWFKGREIYMVHNGNEIWKNQGVPVSGYSSLVGVSPITTKVGGHNGTRFVVGGDNGVNAFIAYSDDNCATFTSVNLNVTGSIVSLAINLSTNKFMAVTDEGKSFTSTDGATWTPGGDLAVGVPPDVQELCHVTGAIWLVRDRFRVFRTTDDGATWTLVLLVFDYPFAIATVNYGSYRICVGLQSTYPLDAKVYESTDDGATWTYDRLVQNSDYYVFNSLLPILNQWPEPTVLADPIIEIDAGDPSKVRIYPSDVIATTHYTLDGVTEPTSLIGDAVLWGQEITVPDGAYLKVISTRTGYTDSGVVEYDRTLAAPAPPSSKICGYVQPAGSSSYVLLVDKSTRQVINEVVPDQATGYYEFTGYDTNNIQNYTVIPLSGEIGLKVITGMDNVTPKAV